MTAICAEVGTDAVYYAARGEPFDALSYY